MAPWSVLGWGLMICAVSAALGLIAWLSVGLRRTSRELEGEPRGTARISPTVRYAPLMRLLGDEDLDFLRKQAGYNAEIDARYRRMRQRSVRQYVNLMKQDYRFLDAEARQLLSAKDATAAAGDIAWNLMRQRVHFECALLQFELRLLSSSFGIGAPNVRPMLEMLESLRREFALSYAPQAV